MVHLGVDDRVVGIAEDIDRIETLLHFLISRASISRYMTTPRSDPPGARGFGRDRPLSFPRHKVLGIDFVEAKLGVRMTRAERIFERLAIIDRHLAVGRRGSAESGTK
jgi:hypothetical protein